MKRVLKFVYIFPLFLFGSTAIFSQNSTTMTKEVGSLLEKKRTYNRLIGSGYTIQLFNGEETKAKKIITDFKGEFPETKVKLLYEAPDWKVQVGHYKVKLNADRASLSFKKVFDNIIVVPIGK